MDEKTRALLEAAIVIVENSDEADEHAEWLAEAREAVKR